MSTVPEIVVTGKAQGYSRASLVAKARKAGFHLADAVSVTTRVVFAADYPANPRKTVKLLAAQAAGTPIFPMSAFVDILDHGLDAQAAKGCAAARLLVAHHPHAPGTAGSGTPAPCRLASWFPQPSRPRAYF